MKFRSLVAIAVHRHIAQTVFDTGTVLFTSDAAVGMQTAATLVFTPEAAPYIMLAIGRVISGDVGAGLGHANLRVAILQLDLVDNFNPSSPVFMVAQRRETVTTARTYTVQVDSEAVAANWTVRMWLFPFYQNPI